MKAKNTRKILGKTLALLLTFLLLLLCGCETEGDRIFSELTRSDTESPVSSTASETESTPVGEKSEKNLSGTLSVAVFMYDPDSAIAQLAEEFMDLHPNVEIVFDYDMTLSESINITDNNERLMRADSYDERLRVELMSGEAPDIVFNTVGQNIFELNTGGAFEDLLPYWENDPEIIKEDYYTEILNAFIVDGKLPVLPMSASIGTVYLNQRVVDGLGLDLSGKTTVNYKELLDWFWQAREQGLISEDAPMSFNNYDPTVFFGTEKSRFIDLESRSSTFDSPEFVSYLEETKEIPYLKDEGVFFQGPVMADELLRCLQTGEATTVDPAYFTAYEYVSSAPESFFIHSGLTGPELREIDLQQYEYLAGPFLEVSTDGAIPVISVEDFAITAGCSDKALAWEFIKHCIGVRDSAAMENGAVYVNGIPLHKRNLAVSVNGSVESYRDDYGYYGKADMLEETADEQFVVGYIEEILQGELINNRLYNVPVSEILDEYYVNELATAEECAGKVQDRAWIYLNE